MVHRILARSVLCATLTVAGAAAPCLAQSSPTVFPTADGTSRTESTLVERLYPVADLVVAPVETAHLSVQNFVKLSGFDKLTQNAPGNANAQPADNQSQSEVAKRLEPAIPATTREGELVNMLTACVDPTSWAGKGGKSTIAYHSGCMTLAIHALPAHHARIAAVLAELRRQQETQVTLEVRMVTISEEVAERVGLNSDTPGAVTTAAGRVNESQVREAPANLPRVTFLNNNQLAELQAAFQGDQHTSIVQLPKVTLFNGQKTRLSAGDLQSFVTKVDPQKIGGQTVMVPQCEVMPTSGFYLSARPTVSADRRYVKLDLQTNFTKLATPNIQLFPVSTLITPVFEGGAVGKPVPFTQFIQQPVHTSLLVDCSLNLPDGGTALLTGYRQMSEGKNEFGPPVLSKVPYLNRLFKNVGYANVSTQVALLVTPRIVMDEDVEMRAVLAHQVSKMRGANPGHEEQKPLAKLLKEYKQACSEGRLSEAQALAARALLLDPACFSR